MSNAIQILEKGDRINITDKAIAAGGDGTKHYVGAGWDKPSNGTADLDLYCVAVSNGLVKYLTYYADKTAIPGISLSEDNTTGAGDGDDEKLVIDTTKLPADIDGLIIGLVSYAGPDFANVPNPLIRLCAGTTETSPETSRYPVKTDAFDGDTILVYGRFKKNSSGAWLFQAIGKFFDKGQGSSAFRALLQLDFASLNA